jgi:predicted nucleic-acid-binding protein
VVACDTNVLARAILGDDPRQSLLARRSLTDAASREGVFVPTVVLVELVWVLEGAGLDRTALAAAVETLLAARGVTVERADVALDAVRAFKQGSAGYADYWIAAAARGEGCRTLLTFDRKLARDPRATLLTR